MLRLIWNMSSSCLYTISIRSEIRAGDPRFLLLGVQLVPRLVLAVFVDREQICGNGIVVSREEEHDGDHTRRHQHYSIGCNGIGVYGSIFVSPHPRLLNVRVAIEGAQIDV